MKIKLTETEITEIRKLILNYCCIESNLDGELYSNTNLEKIENEIYNKYLVNYPEAIDNGDLVEYYFDIGIKKKDKRIIEDALFLLNIASYEVYNSTVILDKLNILLLEEWHFWHENIINILVNDFKNEKSLTFLKRVAIWESDIIWDYEEYLHRAAIRGIFQIAKKDSIQILENLVGKVDEETAPFLQRKIKEAKEIYLNN